jgi:hypothetical protein
MYEDVTPLSLLEERTIIGEVLPISVAAEDKCLSITDDLKGCRVEAVHYRENLQVQSGVMEEEFS